MTTTTAAPRQRSRAIGAVGALALGAGLVLTTPGAAQAAEQTVTGGTLSWGVLGSFQSYFFGGFAGGSTTESGGAGFAGAKPGGDWTWTATGGSVDGGDVSAAFGGTVSFTAHHGDLDIVLSDPRIEISGSTGQLIVDAVSKPMGASTAVVYDDVALLDLAVGGVTPTVDGATSTWTNVPATMTAAGQPIFNSYEAGRVMDPVTFSLTTGTGAPQQPVDPPVDPEDPAGDTATQQLEVVVPEGGTDPGEPGSFSWAIDGGSSAVSLGQATAQDGRLAATGQIKPVTVTDTRTTNSAWSVTAQVSDFSSPAGTLPGKYLGWTPSASGGGAVAGPQVQPGIDAGDGLSQTAVLGSAPNGHTTGTATLGAELDLLLPASTTPGTYTATLTLTALS